MVREIVMSFDAEVKAGVHPMNRDGSVDAFKAMDLTEALAKAEAGEVMYAAAISICESTMRRLGSPIDEKWLHYRGQFHNI